MGILQDRIKEALEEEDAVKRQQMLDFLSGISDPTPFKPEEAEELLERAEDYLEAGEFVSFSALSKIVAKTTDLGEVPTFKNPWLEKFDPEPSRKSMWEYSRGYLVRRFHDLGFFGDGENVVLCEVMATGFGNGALKRCCSLYITDRRLVTIGNLIDTSDQQRDLYRMLYDDWEQYPYLQFYDFFHLDKVQDLELKWGMFNKSVSFKYPTEYAKSKTRTLYGPYFFKAELPRKTEVKEGLLDIKVTAVGDPGKTHRPRLEGLYKEIRSQMRE